MGGVKLKDTRSYEVRQRLGKHEGWLSVEEKRLEIGNVN